MLILHENIQNVIGRSHQQSATVHFWLPTIKFLSERTKQPGNPRQPPRNHQRGAKPSNLGQPGLWPGTGGGYPEHYVIIKRA